MSEVFRASWFPVRGGKKYWPGDAVPDVDQKTLDWLRRSGVIAKVEPSTPVEEKPVESSTPVEETPSVAKPPKMANLAAWQKYARSVGVNPDGLTKAEIVAKVN